jgi:hypothetical protein
MRMCHREQTLPVHLEDQILPCARESKLFLAHGHAPGRACARMLHNVPGITSWRNMGHSWRNN